jgi:Dual OB-containing domain
MPGVDLICLANSYKYSGRCFAGLRTDGGGWVRPVTAAPHGEFGREECAQIAAFDPRLLDVIRTGLERHTPLPYQLPATASELRLILQVPRKRLPHGDGKRARRLAGGSACPTAHCKLGI